MKKTLCVALAMVMAMALMLPVFASENDYELEATGITSAPTIKVTMPGAMTIVLNPYKMDYKNTSLGISTANTGTFISPAAAIKNETDTALAMSVQGALEPSDNLKVVAAENSVQTPSTPGDKNVYAQLNIAVDQTTALTNTMTVVKDITGAVSQPLSTSDKYLWGGTGTGASNPLTLAKVSSGSTFVYIQFSGDVNSNPKEPYTAEDTLGAALVFTFTPVAASGSGS